MITRRNFLQKTILSTTLTSFYLNNFSILNAKTINNRIKNPMLKLSNGKFEEITWKKAFEIIKEKSSLALKQSGVNGLGLYTQSNISIEESYALSKLFKAGFRSNNILTTSHKNDDIQAKARTLIYGIDGSSNTFDDINKTNVLLSFDVDFKNKSNLNTRIENNKYLKYININTNNTINSKAYLNINIKPSTYHILLNFIIRDFLFNDKNNIDMKYLKKHTVFANYKNKSQWEISFKEYKKSFDKYNMQYLIKNAKSNINESDYEFRNNISKLSHIIRSNAYKVLSFTSSTFNESTNSFKTNLLLQSLHLFINKHSRPGCGVMNLNSQATYSTSVDYIGLNNNRLASNMYIKYKEHRTIAQKFWNIPSDTLNPISSNLLKNIKNKTTKFLWITGINENNSQNNIKNKIFDINKNDDLFIVTSEAFMTDTSYNSDLILPTTIQSEKTGSYGDEQRNIKFIKQKNIPYASSMSLLWQILEISKQFSLKDVYKRVRIDEKQALKSVIKGFKLIGYNDKSTLFDILFYNPNTKLFETYDFLNSEKNGDSRNIIGSDGGIFKGYRYFIHEYLFEELRQFGLNKAHDLEHYKNYITNKDGFIWPIINNKQIKYRFNPIDDIYARKSSTYDMKFSFYGKMKGKNLAYGNLNKIINTDKKSLKYRAKIFTTTF